MAVVVSFDEKVQALSGGAAGTSVSAAAGETVQKALFQVARSFPSLHMFNCEGELRSVLKVERNDHSAALTDPIADGDTLRIHV